MSPSVKAMKERINNQKRNNNTYQKGNNIMPIEVCEGVEALIRTNNKRVGYYELKAHLIDMFNTIKDYNLIKGSIIKLSDICDFDYDLLYEDSIEVKKEEKIIEEKIFALI